MADVPAAQSARAVTIAIHIKHDERKPKRAFDAKRPHIHISCVARFHGASSDERP